MKQTRVIFTLALLAALAPAVLQAQQQRDRVEQWDKNGDGKLAKEEFPEPARNRFERIDVDRNGAVTREEMEAYLKRQNPERPDPAIRNPQQQNKRKTPPTHADVMYGDHERNVMDVWLAKSDQPTPVLVSIHGGGFRKGNKSVSPELLDACLKSGVSVVAITYRLSQDAIAPAQFHDVARAIQFTRHHTEKWNIDPDRIASTGGSAGAGLSLWLGFHDDLADASSEDPVRRQSSRLTCMAVSNGQSSYDPRFWRDLFPGDNQAYRIAPLRELFDADLDNLDHLPKEKYALFEEVSPINHLTRDDAPALLTYMVKDSERDIGSHSPRFGYALKKEMDKLGIRSEVVTHLDRDDPRYVPVVMGFILKEFGME